MTILSSSSLFHYTKTFDSLIGILSSGFRFSVVQEPYPQVAWGVSPLTSLGIQRTYVDNKIVCFCDIPLTQASGHRVSYESYAIGLSKDWAKRNFVTPVRYVHSNSPGFSGKIMEFIEMHENQRDLQSSFVPEYLNHKYNRRIQVSSLSDDAQFAVSALERALRDVLDYIALGMPFYKAYELDDPLHHTTEKKYYDEREWRAFSEKKGDQYLTFLWEDIDIILCATRADCKRLYKRRKEFSEHLRIRPVSMIWQKLYSFEEIDANF